MFAGINGHMTLVWRSISVVVCALAMLALVEKHILPIDIAMALVVLVCALVPCAPARRRLMDNRNLTTIADIERQFVRSFDARPDPPFRRAPLAA